MFSVCTEGRTILCGRLAKWTSSGKKIQHPTRMYCLVFLARSNNVHLHERRLLLVLCNFLRSPARPATIRIHDRVSFSSISFHRAYLLLCPRRHMQTITVHLPIATTLFHEQYKPYRQRKWQKIRWTSPMQIPI